MILTIALPESLREQGNQFARCIGMGPDDDKTFSHEAAYEDAAGIRYVVTSGWVVDHFADIATGELIEPPWGCDMLDAQTIQAMIRLGEPAAPDVVAAVFDDDVDAAIEAMGLTILPPPEDPAA